MSIAKLYTDDGFERAQNWYSGWVELERGSLNVLRSGWETQAGVAAIIPDVSTDPTLDPTPVPLPFGGALLLSGLFALGFVSQRKV